MNNTIKRKCDAVGMNISTAQGRLYKLIMFNLAKECNKLICYRCGKHIELKDFSVDHKEDWLHSDNARELFFDYNNIAFSHNKCNSGARRKKQGTDSKTGFKGVWMQTKGNRSKKYRAFLYCTKTVSIGSYATAEDAARAYDEYAIKIHGDKAITNKGLGLL